MRQIFIALVATVMLSGCSVWLAASGEPDPDLGAIKVGSTRSDVELHLGQPKETAQLADGRRKDVYHYQIGNEPSTGRAIAHGTMDVLTLGLWEVVGTPIEGFAGKNYRLFVTYDEFDLVEEMRTIEGS